MNKIALFKNEKKNEKAPELNAIIEIDGIKYETGLWKKTSKSGATYYSGTPTVKEVKPQEKAPPPQSEDDYLNDEVPFD